MAEVIEDVVLTGEEDKLEPWTIKVFSRNVRNRITAAAKQEGITTGAWVERTSLDRLEGRGQQGGHKLAAVPAEHLAQSLSALAAIMQAACQVVETKGMPEDAVRNAVSTINSTLRAARALVAPSPRPRGEARG